MFAIIILTSLLIMYDSKCISNKHFHIDSQIIKSTNFNISYFFNFNNYTDLINNCQYNITNHLNFLPNNFLIIDKDLAIEKLVKPNELSSLKTLIITNVKGIDLNSIRIFKKQTSILDKQKYLVFNYVKLNIYKNGKLIK